MLAGHQSARALQTLLFTLLTLCSNMAMAATVKVVIENIQSAEGAMRVAVCADEASFDARNCSWSRTVSPQVPNIAVEFKELPKLPYLAVLVYQDLNGNGELDKNFLGIPQEPIGFSRNPEIRFAAPDFNETKIAIERDNLIVPIRMRNR